jgi:hypothetical protein
MDHCVVEIYILPLQTQALRDAETCASSQERQSTFRLSQVSDDCISLCGRYDHGFVAAACLAANEAHWIRFLSSWNQAISLAMAIEKVMRNLTPLLFGTWQINYSN